MPYLEYSRLGGGTSSYWLRYGYFPVLFSDLVISYMRFCICWLRFFTYLLIVKCFYLEQQFGYKLADSKTEMVLIGTGFVLLVEQVSFYIRVR